MRWYERPMRISALQCNFGEDTLKVSDIWKKNGFNVEQLFHPIADCYSALFDAKKHKRIMSEYIAKSKKNNIRIILYMNCHILGPSQNKHKDKWAQRDRNGKFTMMYGSYYGCCINSPWGEYFYSVIDGLKHFDIDGIFLDGPAFGGEGCFCGYCRDKYEKEYGEDLKSGKNRKEFYTNSTTEFLRESYLRLKRAKPDRVSYMNMSVMHPSASNLDLKEALKYNDIVGTEGGFMFYAPPKDAVLWRPSVSAKILSAVAPEKPAVIFMAGDQKPWSWYMHAPAETKLCIASSVANGAGIWYGLHGSTKLLSSPGGKAGMETIRFLAKNEKYYEKTESGSRIAILFSFDTEKNYKASAVESDFYGQKKTEGEFFGNFTESLYGFVDVFSRAGIPYDVITDMDLTMEKLSRYDCIFLPTCACLSENTIAAIKEYVMKGGNIVASFDVSLYDEKGKQRKDFGLKEVFGVRYLGNVVRYRNYNYFSVTGKHELFGSIEAPLLPAPEFGLEVAPLKSARVLARFHSPMKGRYVELTKQENPAVIINKFGRGKSLYLAGTFGETMSSYAPVEYRLIISNAVRTLSRRPVRIEGGNGNVEVVLRKQPGRLIVHLINYAGIVPRPFNSVCPARDVKLFVAITGKCKSVIALYAGRNCAFKQVKNRLEIPVPEFSEYEVVVVEVAVEKDPLAILNLFGTIDFDERYDYKKARMR